MSPTVRNILAVVAGLVIGGAVNMGLVQLGNTLYPLPEGIDPNNMDQLKEAIANFKPIQFLFPFLAHSMGTLVGAFTAAMIAATGKAQLALIIGLVFLAGGVAMVVSVGGPIWFILLDLIVAYLPMAWLGGKLGVRYSG
jgi:uncharacterized membrane protein YqgA involved in biofilm formation